MLEISPKSPEVDDIESEDGVRRPDRTKGSGILAQLATGFDTLLVAAMAIALVVGAHLLLSSRAAMVPAATAAPPQSVTTMTAELVDTYRISRQFVGQVEPAQTTRIGFELAGRINDLPVDEAATVRKGQVLARMDTSLLDNERRTQMAARNALAARMEKSRLISDRRKKLNDKGFLSNQLVDDAQLNHDELSALMAQMDSTIAGIDIRIDKSVIRAPFDGQIGDRFVDVGATVSAGQPVFTIMQGVAPQMRVGLSEEMVASLNIGDSVTARIGSRNFPASLEQVRADIDPGTRTHTALFSLQLEDGAVIPQYGQIGTVTLWRTVRQRGAWVPVSALRDGKRGLWTVMSVQTRDGRSVVATEAVEVLYASQERAFVRGTFRDKARIVADGLHRISAGQTVRIANATR